MTWARRFALRQGMRQNLWLVPLIGAVVGSLLAVAVASVDERIDIPSLWDYTPATSQAVLAAIAGSMIGLVGFVVTVTVLMVQMAVGTFSARYLRLLYRSSMLKATLAVLLGTFGYTLMALRRTEGHDPDLAVATAGICVVAGVTLFLLFFSRFLQSLRPVAVCAAVAQMGLETFREGTHAAAGPSRAAEDAGPGGAVVRSERSGTIQAIDLVGLVRFAERHGCVLVFAVAVGDFVSPGAELVEIRGGTPPQDATAAIEGKVALGKERTIEQDPAFAVRVMVDIGSRALSPAVNDPTTAVQVLDYLEDMLLVIGGTDLSERGVFRDGGGTARVVLPSRSWDAYLSLGVTELRQFGAGSVQVLRRLRALLERLRIAVLPEHAAAVDAELARLDATVRAMFGSTVDLALAEAADRQGLGGPA